jgi:hypothetical protein
MNRRHVTIKFTYEMENDNTLCFLDTTIQRTENGLKFNIFRKPTSTSRYITNDSYHPIQHKKAAFNSMIDRCFTIPMSTDDQQKEVSKIKQIAQINGYRENTIDIIYKKRKKKEQLKQLTTLTPSMKENLPRSTMTFYPPLTNKLQNIFRQHKIE